MCGIAGVMRFDNKRVSEQELKLMTDCMRHRGPDDDGFATADNMGIAMRRLSIIDVSGGHQPLSNEDGKLQLVFNGEIYNYIELRQELIQRGHKFATGSDAEIILHLYEEKGTRALEDLNGMFAFALYDSEKKLMWVGRDRLGIKPFFYAKTNNYFAFSSDLKSLREFHPATLSETEAITYLALGYSPQEQTLWNGIQKLLPAHHALINSNGQVTIERYWSLDKFGTWTGTEEEAANELAYLLQDAVKLQMRTDVPFGVFLSGGIDSSALVAIAAGQLNEPLKTFTIEFEGKKSSGDAFFAREVAKRYATEHFAMPMTSEDAMTALDEVLKVMDEPIGDSAVLPVYALSKFARKQGIKVLLNGAGATRYLVAMPVIGRRGWVVLPGYRKIYQPFQGKWFPVCGRCFSRNVVCARRIRGWHGV
jgi:asparagine synthase (glutamine-hydrolysing)